MSTIPIVAIAIVSALGTAVTLRLARRALIDHPNQRSSHTVPTPRGGGLGIVVGICAGVLLFDALPLRAALLPILLAAALSFADDVQSLPALVRLVGHIAVAGVSLAVLGSLKMVAIPPVITVTLPLAVGVLTALWIAGLANAFNFMDGIDGIAATQGLIAGIAWWGIGTASGLTSAALGGAILAAACLGFLPFNWQPAKIFMGDVGSVTLGVTLALLPVIAAMGGAEVWAAPVGALIVWPFLFDATYTFASRLARGERVLEAHRTHLYQRLVIAGWSHRLAASVYGVSAAITALAGWRVSTGEWGWGLAAAIAVSIALLGATRTAERSSMA